MERKTIGVYVHLQNHPTQYSLKFFYNHYVEIHQPRVTRTLKVTSVFREWLHYSSQDKGDKSWLTPQGSPDPSHIVLSKSLPMSWCRNTPPERGIELTNSNAESYARFQRGVYCWSQEEEEFWKITQVYTHG